MARWGFVILACVQLLAAFAAGMARAGRRVCLQERPPGLFVRACGCADFYRAAAPALRAPLQEKDRAKFGPEYGDRFCMLQLVGRHEMDKVQLQHESEGGHKLMVSVSGGQRLQDNSASRLGSLPAYMLACLLLHTLLCSGRCHYSVFTTC